MGKSKKKKFGGRNPNPTGLPSVRECEADFELTSVAHSMSGALQDIIENLQSPGEEARECGCTTIASLVSEPKAIDQLMKLNVVKILGPLVIDHSLEVRHKALGALRNLSVDGGQRICEEMLRCDVMTPLVALFHQFGKGENLRDDVKLKQKDLLMEIYTQAAYLLLNLCEASDLAVSIFNKENLWVVLSSILISPDYSDSLKVAVAQCLYTVTEDNSELTATDMKQTIVKSVSATGNTSEVVLLRTLSMGILVNMVGGTLSSAHGDLVVPMVTALAEVLGIGVLAAIQNKQEGSGDMECSSADGKEEKPPDLKKEAIADVENLLSAQKVALEIIANLCCPEDDGWEDMSSSESGCDDVTDDVTSDEPMEDNNNCEMSLCVPTELHTAYVDCGIVHKVLSLAQPVTDEELKFLEAYSSGKSLLKRFSSRQTHALLCLNNLLGSLDTAAFGGAEKLYPVWQGLVTLSKEQNCIENHELLEASTSAMRALIDMLTQEDPSKFSEVSVTDLQYMFEMTLKCLWPDVRVNWLRIVSTIGAVLSKSQQLSPLLKDIGVFLLEVVCKDSDLWVVAEALDSIFDVFGEDHVDPVLEEIGMIEKLKSIAPALKSKIHSNKKVLGEHYPVIVTARTNLVRFIKYKSKT